MNTLTIKIKNCCALKDTIKKMKRQHTEREKIFANYPIKDQYLKYNKKLITQ